MQANKPANRKLASDFGVLFLAQILIQAVTALTGIIIARTFTPMQYADYLLAFTGLNIAMLLSDFGLTQIVSRQTVLLEKPVAKKLLYNALSIRITLSWLTYIAILVITSLWSVAGNLFLTAIAGLTLFPSAFVILATANLNSTGKTAKSASLNSLASIINALSLLLALWLWQEVVAVLAAGVLASTISAILLWLTIRKETRKETGEQDKKKNPKSSATAPDSYAIKALLKLGVTFLAINLASLLFQYADIYLVSALVPDEQLGWYGAALRLTGLVTVGATVWGIAALPRFSKMYATGDPQEKSLTRRWTLILTVGGIIQAIVLLPLAEIIVNILLGAKYLPATDIVAILGWYTAAIFAGTVAVNRLIAHGKQKQVALVLCLSGICSLVLAYSLIYGLNMGITGAAIAKAVGGWLLTVGYLFFNK
jgi:O-antigen/teichoic acid export membrane protein